MSKTVKYAIGVDLGGTNIKIGIVTDKGKLTKKISVKTEAEAGPKKVISNIQKGIEENIIKPLPVDYLMMLISSLIYGLNDYLIKNEFSKPKQHAIISDTFDLLWDMVT